MHEFALCNDLVNAVLSAAENQQANVARVLRVRIVIGKLRQVVPDTMRLAFESLARGTVAENAQLEMDFRDISAECSDCGWAGVLSACVFLCPQCSGRNVQLTGGRELYLDQIEVEENGEDEQRNPRV